MTGAEKLVSAMKKVNQSGQPAQSQLLSATVTKTNPLTFKIENRLEITKDFYELSTLEDWSTLQVGDKVRCFTYNNGQTYFINEKLTGRRSESSVDSQLDDLEQRVTRLEQIIGGLNL